MENQTPQRLLPLSAMARRINIRPQDLRAAAASGDLPCIRVGGAMLFDAPQVERILAERAAAAAAPTKGGA